MRYGKQTLTGIPIVLVTLPIACENAPSATIQMMPEALDISVGAETTVEVMAWVEDRDLAEESGWLWYWHSFSPGEIGFIYGDQVYWRRDAEHRYTAAVFIRATEVGTGVISLIEPDDRPELGFDHYGCTITIIP